MKWPWLGVLAGCAGSSNAPPISNQLHAQRQWVLGEGGLAPITADTRPTKEALEVLFPALRVSEVVQGEDGSGRIFEVHSPTEKLFYVVPDDAESDTGPGDDIPHRYADTIFAVFVTSPSVVVEGKPWRVGGAVDASDIIGCECWGVGEVTACWTNTAHLRLVFEQPCEQAVKDGGKAMAGKPIARIMWQRQPGAVPSPQ